MTPFEKKRISMRYWLLGKDFHVALEAMEYASTFHVNKRKDDITPEFDHQLSIGHYIRTLIDELRWPELTLAAVFLHDVCEDYDVGFEEIEVKFGSAVKTAVSLLTKKHRGDSMDLSSYYKDMITDPIASIVKGADRIHNIQTMTEVFDLSKQKKYLKETEDHVLPMLRLARRKFSIQEPAYENIKHVLRSQVQLIKAIHDAKNGS